MDKIIDVANYIIEKYSELTKDTKETLGEMKLHKLLYFTQRESLAITNEPAFEGDFEGWRYGPVSREVRDCYLEGEIMCCTNEISDSTKYIVNNVILEYGSLTSWKLSELSHKEKSWKNSRVGLAATENGNRLLKLEDIRDDAKKVRPYDHVWDMYYDEFDDYEEVE